jgi:hypothetical protein
MYVSFLGIRDGEYILIDDTEYSICDVNRDGVVDQLDVTRAQRYYGTADSVCDVNGDGTVDIEDLILILNHTTEV